MLGMKAREKNVWWRTASSKEKFTLCSVWSCCVQSKGKERKKTVEKFNVSTGSSENIAQNMCMCKRERE